jgi:DNA-binding PadR family transcriptional regulator
MPETRRDVDSLLPLTPTVFHVLLAVAGEPRHGYAIMQEVNERSDGRVGIGPGTLYGAIRRMVEAGLRAEADPPAGDDDPRRRYYGLTDLGRAAMGAEVERLKKLVAHGEAAVRKA